MGSSLGSTQPNRLRVIFTDHARSRAVDRGIDENEIVRIVNNPIEEIFDQKNSNFKCYGQAMDYYIKQTRYLMIVHSGKFNNSVKIITSMWIDPQGLQFYGFNKI
ncbi:DUF4258 domain-containing protein [Candidatus Nitrosotenuis sp. DW1]|uniref:DUF4258 domain-containing protein n=1 Tax=Candidatus Nitrosotenuis sp. DW1 TaxID=2259672 RepID=UPI0015C96344|nr:DUF4258 domain-containing protein [Candidatus Nitrosotenuis sp. DW1]QLH09450.1 hypothetical protein DSQ19_08165 [Candidatus Nitrosotenuis sp. DW1]